MATAYAAMHLGMNCHIVVPRRTPTDVCEVIRSYGATVELFGNVWEEANSQAIKRTTISKTSFLVHPFDHPVLWQVFLFVNHSHAHAPFLSTTGKDTLK